MWFGYNYVILRLNYQGGGINSLNLLVDRYYFINSAQTKENMVHYILQSHHIFIRVKVFIFMLVPGGHQFLIISTRFAWRPVTSISKSLVLT